MALTVKPDAIPGDDIGGEIVLVECDNTSYAPVAPSAGTTAVDIKDIALSDIIHTANKTEKKNEKQEVRKVTNTYGITTTGMIMPVSYTHLDVYKRQL